MIAIVNLFIIVMGNCQIIIAVAVALSLLALYRQGIFFSTTP